MQSPLIFIHLYVKNISCFIAKEFLDGGPIIYVETWKKYSTDGI